MNVYTITSSKLIIGHYEILNISYFDNTVTPISFCKNNSRQKCQYFIKMYPNCSITPSTPKKEGYVARRNKASI